MNTFLDLLQNKNFRSYVERRIVTETENNKYSFSNVFPALYKYSSMSKAVVNNILASRITATSIGEFNDLFDGALHYYGTKEERTHSAEKKWKEFEKLRIAAGLPDSLLEHDNYVGMCTEHFKTESRLKFRVLDYLGTYVCCLSSKCDSTLMWAHYAKSNTGICVEYDFNDANLDSYLKNMIFPVAYSQKPMNLHDLLDDEKSKVYQYSLEAAVLCATLNKATVWSYENEWRLVLVLATAKDHKRRLPFNVPLVPKSIALGYHFLKPFFYYDDKDKKEKDLAAEHIDSMVRLLEYMKAQQIPALIMAPSIGRYTLVRKPIEVDSLIKLISRHFTNNDPQNMCYYYVVHDELMNLIEK